MNSSPRLLRLATLVVLGTASTACVMPDQIESLRKDVADVQQELRSMQRGQRDVKEQLTALEQDRELPQEAVTRTEFADVALRLDETARDVAILDEQLSDAHRRIDNLSQDIQGVRTLTLQDSTAPQARSGADAAASLMTDNLDDRYGSNEDPGQAVPRPDDLYNSAYADFSKGNYTLAVSGFEEYASRYAESDLADNALYWVGECQFSQGDYPMAIQSFDRMLSQYPKSDRSAAAHLKKGLSFLEQNQIGKAIVQLEFVRETYAGSDEARVARDKLTSLGEGN